MSVNDVLGQIRYEQRALVQADTSSNKVTCGKEGHQPPIPSVETCWVQYLLWSWVDIVRTTGHFETYHAPLPPAGA